MSLKDDIKREEGWVPHAYQDHLGYWTIGYGFLIDQNGGSLPKVVADYWLDYILSGIKTRLYSALPWLESQPEEVQRALGNMAYQLGIDGLLRFKMMLAALEIGDRKLAAKEALNSKWAAQTPERAGRVAALIRGS